LLYSAREEVSNVCSAWLHDPLLATLPRMLDHHPQLAAYFLRLLSIPLLGLLGLDGEDFRTLYMSRIFPLLGSLEPFPLSDTSSSSPLATDPIALLAEVGQKPLELSDYYLHLSGIHAID